MSETASHPPTSLAPSAPLSILLIEDDPYACRVLGDYFRRAGHGIVTVGLAEEGLDALRREIFDVVLVDLKLPRMSGMDFLREIQSEDPPPVIVVTADTEKIGRAHV